MRFTLAAGKRSFIHCGNGCVVYGIAVALAAGKRQLDLCANGKKERKKMGVLFMRLPSPLENGNR